MQADGLPVAETETKMMQKIEELTLYVIQLQKEIDQLKAHKNENDNTEEINFAVVFFACFCSSGHSKTS